MSMGDPGHPPEIPYPYPPFRETPRRSDPVLVPLVSMPSSDPVQTLLDRRTIMVSGRLDHDRVTGLCAELMSLDGRSRDSVTIILNSVGGPVGDVGAALDVLDLMRAPVDVRCIGAANGTAAVLLACAPGDRLAGRHARISLRVEPEQSVAGTADEVSQRAAEHVATLRRIADRVAAATGHTIDVTLGELEHGVPRDADAALAFGIVDRVVESGRAARVAADGEQS